MLAWQRKERLRRPRKSEAAQHTSADMHIGVAISPLLGVALELQVRASAGERYEVALPKEVVAVLALANRIGKRKVAGKATTLPS